MGGRQALHCRGASGRGDLRAADRGPRLPAGRPRGTAVVATPPAERHAMPALMAAACLRENRWLVRHLAADLPVAEISRLAVQVSASFVVLSTATTAGEQ